MRTDDKFNLLRFFCHAQSVSSKTVKIRIKSDFKAFNEKALIAYILYLNYIFQYQNVNKQIIEQQVLYDNISEAATTTKNPHLELDDFF